MAELDPITNFNIQSGEQLWEHDGENKALIEGFLWEEDLVMLLGSEKAGKSILGLQMAFCLTSKTPFLDKYAVPEAVPVLYVQTEGKKPATIERMECMRETLDINDKLFYRVYKRFLPFDLPEVVNDMVDKIDQLPIPPKVIILDSLYTSMLGDLIDNKETRRFFAMVSPILHRYHAALIIIHHETKDQFEDGHVVEKGDKSSYGSVFLRAWVEHILYLKKHKDKSRTLTCDTQRSGAVMEREELILVEPKPLCFEIKGDWMPYEQVIKGQISKQPMTREQIAEITGLSPSAITKALRHIEQAGLLTKSESRPVAYQILP